MRAMSRKEVLSTTALSTGKGLQALMVEERGEQGSWFVGGKVRVVSPGEDTWCAAKCTGLGARRAEFEPVVCWLTE